MQLLGPGLGGSHEGFRPEDPVGGRGPTSASRLLTRALSAGRVSSAQSILCLPGVVTPPGQPQAALLCRRLLRCLQQGGFCVGLPEPQMPLSARLNRPYATLKSWRSSVSVPQQTERVNFGTCGVVGFASRMVESLCNIDLARNIASSECLLGPVPQASDSGRSATMHPLSRPERRLID